jgi:hypothetical protein
MYFGSLDESKIIKCDTTTLSNSNIFDHSNLLILVQMKLEVLFDIRNLYT